MNINMNRIFSVVGILLRSINCGKFIAHIQSLHLGKILKGYLDSSTRTVIGRIK